MPRSPTALTLDHLRRHGFTVDIAERWVPRANIRRDLFGLFDLVALDSREPGIVGVQVTTVGHMADRLRKIQARPELALWLRCGGRAWVVGWKKQGGRWRVKIVAVRTGDLEAVPLTPARRRRGRQPVQGQLFD
jgi:hypothetical protein